MHHALILLTLMTTRIRKASKWLMLAVLVILSLWGTVTSTRLYRHAQQPVDAILVLGGSIRRELHVAEQMAKRRTEPLQIQKTTTSAGAIPILVSKGSKPPCIRILFERAAAPINNVWLEDCAKSTFDNYRYSLPILKSWQVHHVQVVTSPTHVPRAQWLAQIILGSHGIWVEMDLVEEKGIPGNIETPIKTGLDVTRSLLWAILSQLYSPPCPTIMPLASVNLNQWEQRGFKCEHQANIN